jgi:galactokinase
MINIQNLAKQFEQYYGIAPRIFYAPGRVNLIGEHTDYNDGFVLPMAIHQGTAAAIAVRSDRKLRVRSLNLNDSIELNLDRLGCGRQGGWQDYVEGVAASIMARGVSLKSADILILSDVPIGGGLSSSAALEMALGSSLVALSNSSIDKSSLALAGQEAEHQHVGIQCGIMDQFTSVHAVRNHALLLDCRSLKVKQIPLNLGKYQIVICDSRVRHSLAASEYNLRRRDCEAGVQSLAANLPAIRALRDVTLDQLEANRSKIAETVFRRCRHVVSENMRTLRAAEALIDCDIATMGLLMNASHQSLRDDYEVSCPELDLLVESAQVQAGVLGSRMTGGGFGGCTVNLVEASQIAAFRENVSKAYQAQTHIVPEIFSAESADGARELFLN